MSDTVDRGFSRKYQQAMDQDAADNGLLDPDQPTLSAHTAWFDAATAPFSPEEFTPTERMMIRLGRS